MSITLTRVASSKASTSSVLVTAAGLMNGVSRSTFNAARNSDGSKVSPPSGKRFARMTKEDAEWYQQQIEAGKITNLTPFGAIVIASKLLDADWKAVRSSMAKTLGLPDGKLGPWNESVTDSGVIRAAFAYAYAVAKAAND